MHQNYKRQVSLLLKALTEVAKEACFALHGGTAINLFVRNMPRLSVDVNLTYIPIEDRKTTLQNISDALARIGQGLEKVIPHVKVALRPEISKLLVSVPRAQIKIEVNQTMRGVLTPTNRTDALR